MTIKVGEKVPSVTLMHMTDKGPAPVTTDELFSKKKVVLFALPGAFTPTCSARHLPGYVEHNADFAKKFSALWSTNMGMGLVRIAETIGR